MKKLVFACVLFCGISVVSYACEAAFAGLKLERDTFGKFSSKQELYAAFDAWVQVAC